jgi:gluconate 2-dehydrogenase gamma chain
VRNTFQGYFADPIYGGNRDMAAWRMIGFPGAYAQYVELVDAHDRPFRRPPMSIAQVAHHHAATP